MKFIQYFNIYVNNMYAISYYNSLKSFYFIEHNINCFYRQDHMQKKTYFSPLLIA